MTKLKCLLKRYEKARKKASTLYEKIVEAYEEAYLINDVRVTQEICNTLFNYTNCHEENTGVNSVIYADTDSVKDNKYYVKTTNRCGKAVYHLIYKDFDKKREI